jgi:hypothetical protein
MLPGIFAGGTGGGAPVNPDAASIYAKLSAWWEMDEGSGSRLDSVGPNDLAVVSTVSTGTGVRGGGDVAAAFAGGGALVAADATEIRVPSGGGDHCLFGWFYLNSNTSGQCFAAKWDQSNAPNMEYMVDISTGPNIRGINGGTGYTIATITPPSAAAWHFVVLWRDSADGFVRIQIDNGTPVATGSASNPSPGARSLGFGQFGSSTGGRMTGRLQRWGYIKGAILTADEKTYLYNSGNSVTFAELQAAAGA